MLKESFEDVLFVPNAYYITLLKELNAMGLRNSKGIAYGEIRAELKNIERTMSSGDIIRNTKMAFNN